MESLFTTGKEHFNYCFVYTKVGMVHILPVSKVEVPHNGLLFSDVTMNIFGSNILSLTGTAHYFSDWTMVKRPHRRIRNEKELKELKNTYVDGSFFTEKKKVYLKQGWLLLRYTQRIDIVTPLWALERAELSEPSNEILLKSITGTFLYGRN